MTMACHTEKVRIMDNWTTDSMLYEDDQLNQSLINSLMESRKQGRFTDISIVVENKTFPCHKFVIEANCPYFNAYFSFSGQSEEVATINLEGVSASAFELMLDFLYTSKITINLNNVQELIQCADFLQCSDVTKACGNFLIPHVSIKNCLELYQCSEAFSVKALREETRKFILSHFRQLMKTSEFMSMPLDTLKGIVSDDKLSVPNESNVLAAILKWLSHDSSRLASSETILEAVRWEYVEPCFLDGLKTAVSEEVRDKVMAAKERHKSGDSKRLKAVLGVVDIELSTGFCFHSRQAGEFCEEARFPFSSRSRFHCAQYDNNIYLTGGILRLEKQVTAEVHKFDIATFKWEKKLCMQIPRYNHSSACLDGRLYVIGGQDKETSGPQLLGEVYNLYTDQWSLIKCLPKPVNIPGVPIATSLIPLQNKLYLIASVWAYAYDPSQDDWSSVPELEKTPIDIKSCCAVKGLLVFFEPEYEIQPRKRWQDSDDSDEERERVAKISKLCVYNPLCRSLPTQEAVNSVERLRAERKINGGVVLHNDNLLVFRYTLDEEDSMFMFEAEVVALCLHGSSPRFRFFADYNAIPFDDSELFAFSGFANPDLM